MGASFSAGLYLGTQNNASTDSQNSQNKAETRTCNSSIPPLANETNPQSLIDVKTQSDANEMRHNLVQYVWKGQAFPDHQLPDRVKNDVRYKQKDVTLNNIDNPAQIDRLTVSMEHNVTSYAYHLRPKESNGDLIVFMMGHYGHLMWRKATIERLVNGGYTVIGIPMPLSGSNNNPIVNSSQFGTFRLEHHNQLRYLETSEFSPIQYFLEPVTVAVTYAE